MTEDRLLLLDACSLINLVACGVPLGEIAQAAGGEFVITTFAAAESLFVMGDENEASVPVSVQSLAEAGQVTVTPLTGPELAHFVDLARTLDDGEASTIAVACARGLELATDDRRAIRVAADKEVVVLTTSQLMRNWAETSNATEEEISRALLNIEHRGNFSPARNDPERAWWTEHIS